MQNSSIVVSCWVSTLYRCSLHFLFLNSKCVPCGLSSSQSTLCSCWIVARVTPVFKSKTHTVCKSMR